MTATLIERPTTLTCAQPGCTVSIAPDPRHVANLTARGEWRCAAHAVAA